MHNKNIADAREKVFQMFGSDGLRMFDDAVRDEAGTIVIDDRRVLFYGRNGNLIFRAGDRLSDEAV
ncbi:hypothetical protein [Pantoea agglomerans]|uniref:hypothetical protein n=1 Tax=Enterobacter agglomerans TaxID=549 RepID=UPI001781C3AE|nr:hypothetical protein [Pantoea agglomerans]MBD8153314.1 hypothetical protein [Pantoea agglomerans]